MINRVTKMPVSPTHTQNPNTALNTSNWFFMGILGALMAFTSLSTDIYLPAMPQMAHEQLLCGKTLKSQDSRRIE